MRTVFRACGLILFFCIIGSAVLSAQTSSVTAEAMSQANLRSATNIESDVVGNITSGTRYPVIGRSALYPWLLLGDPASGQPLGWVFRDIVTVQGDVNSVPVTENTVNAAAGVPPTPTLLSLAPGQSTPAAPLTTATLPAPTIQATAAPGAVTGTVLNEINIRYGPGTEYERVGVGFAGETFRIVAYHTQFPWVQIEYPASPTGFAWVNMDLFDIQGDVYTLQPVSQTSFNLPTLTPTLSPVEALDAAGVPISPEFRALADAIWTRMLASNFDPATSRLGAFYLKNLQTGETVTVGDNIAFSGMSLNKIAILTTLYGQMDRPPADADAVTIAEAMVCSENISTNEMLAMIGGGNPWTGASRVSQFLQNIGLENTFIYTPYDNDPFITPEPAQTRITEANQTATDPDPFNQITIGELGTLLDDIYQCGYGTSSPLLTTTAGTFTPTECRQLLNTMTHNRIGNLIESGTAEGVRVAHKHGWINDTHGDAGLVFSPGGNYIFVMVLRNPEYLEFADSEPLIEESARDIYNYFNPDAPLDAVRPPDVDGQCHLLDSSVVPEMMQLEFTG